MVHCLFCDRQDIDEKDLLIHLTEDIHYSRNRCATCQLRSYGPTEMFAHSTETGHCVVLNESTNPYKEDLLMKLHNDCLGRSTGEGEGNSMQQTNKPQVPQAARRTDTSITSKSGNTATYVTTVSPCPAAIYDTNVSPVATPRSTATYVTAVSPDPTPEPSWMRADDDDLEMISIPSVNYSSLNELETVHCKMCSSSVAVRNNYAGHRAHVYEKHPPPQSHLAKGNEVQEYLKTTLRQCFPLATILNDVTCQLVGCGKQVGVYDSHPRSTQMDHVRRAHVSSMLRCPVGDCSGFVVIGGNIKALRNHIYNEHEGVQRLFGEEKKKYDELRKELTLETEKILVRCFPFAPGEDHRHHQHQRGEGGNSSASGEGSGDEEEEGYEEGEVPSVLRAKRFRTFDWQGP